MPIIERINAVGASRMWNLGRPGGPHLRLLITTGLGMPARSRGTGTMERAAFSGNVTIGSSIVSGNKGPNCTGALTSLGYNLSNDAAADNTCGFTQPTDRVGVNPELGPLANNGGPTESLLPPSTSPAAGIVPRSTTLNGVQVCPRLDERGVASIGHCAIGAVEPFAISTTSLVNATPGMASARLL